jgi:branched-chain amino acid transport system permease protein
MSPGIRRWIGPALVAAWAAILAFPLAGLDLVSRTATGADGALRHEWIARLKPRALLIGGGVLALLGLWAGLRALLRVVPERWRPAAVAARIGDASTATPGRRWALFLAGGAFLLALPDLFGAQGDKYAQVCFDAQIWILLALGLNIVVGMAGLLVLGYCAFLNVGAYTFAILCCRYGLPFWAALPLGAAAGGLFGLLLGLPSLRLRGDYLAIVTLGFGETLRYFLVNEAWLTGGPDGIPCSAIRGHPAATTTLLEYRPELLTQTDALRATPGGRLDLFLHVGMDDPFVAYYIGLVCVVLGVFAASRLSHSRLGRALVALREDEVAAKAMGISTNRLKILAFVLAAAWAGVVGVLAVGRKNQITPEDYKFPESVLVLSMVVLGGMGSVPGAVLGAILLYFIPFLIQEWFPDFQTYRPLLFGAVMVAFMVLRPQGLFGAGRRMKAPDEDDAEAAPGALPAGTAP